MSIKIAALVSTGKHPRSGQARHCHNDSLALQIGLSLASNIKVLHAGDPNNAALQDYLALGALQIDVIPATGNMVENLAAQLENIDLILTGTRAENDQDSGLLPYLLAAELKLPIVTGALEISPSAGELEVLQFLPKGARRHVKVKLPAVIVVHPLATAKLHYAHALQSLGRINMLPASNNAVEVTQWRTEPARKPIKLAACANLTGHERLMAAISNKAKGGAVVNEGNNVEKAQVILAYLREHQLINF